MNNKRLWQQIMVVLLVMLSSLGCVAPMITPVAHTPAAGTETPKPTTPTSITPTATSAKATPVLAEVTCLYDSEFKANIKVASVEKMANLELAPPPPGMKYTGDATGKAKGIFLLATLELTRLEENAPEKLYLIRFDLTDQKGNQFKQAGTAQNGQFEPGTFQFWTAHSSAHFTTTLVFDVPTDASIFHLSGSEGCEIDLMTQ